MADNRRQSGRQSEHLPDQALLVEGCPVYSETCVAESVLWQRKREHQRRDMEALAAGTVTEDDLSWFSRGRSRLFKLVDSPY